MNPLPISVVVVSTASFSEYTEPVVSINPTPDSVQDSTNCLQFQIPANCDNLLTSIAQHLFLFIDKEVNLVWRIFYLRAFAAVCKQLGLNTADLMDYPLLQPSSFNPAPTPAHITTYIRLLGQLFGTVFATVHDAQLTDKPSQPANKYPLLVVIAQGDGPITVTTEPLVFINPTPDYFNDTFSYLHLQMDMDKPQQAVKHLAESLELNTNTCNVVERIFDLKAFAAVCKELNLKPECEYCPVVRPLQNTSNNLLCDLVQEIFGIEAKQAQAKILSNVESDIIASGPVRTAPAIPTQTRRIVLRYLMGYYHVCYQNFSEDGTSYFSSTIGSCYRDYQFSEAIHHFTGQVIFSNSDKV